MLFSAFPDDIQNKYCYNLSLGVSKPTFNSEYLLAIPSLLSLHGYLFNLLFWSKNNWVMTHKSAQNYRDH